MVKHCETCNSRHHDNEECLPTREELNEQLEQMRKINKLYEDDSGITKYMEVLDFAVSALRAMEDTARHSLEILEKMKREVD